jgi:hypothetical protein
MLYPQIIDALEDADAFDQSAMEDTKIVTREYLSARRQA